ncbi:MAG: hypothetical protein ACUVXB_05210 [Bryobacteraceae bacterium]
MNFLSFDIEIADVFDLKPGQDLNRYAPFRIAVAAVVHQNGTQRVFYSQDPEGRPAPEMNRRTALELLDYLAGKHREGWRLFAWNGLSFDLRWIGYNAGDTDAAAQLALDLYDPMFQFFHQRGFPVSLAAVGEAMGIPQRKLMSAADAPKEWRKGNHQRVIDYVVGDCLITNQIVEAVARRGILSWRTSKGTVQSEPMPRFKTVAEILREPQPDQSWMKGPGKRRSDFTDWIPAHILALART